MRLNRAPVGYRPGALMAKVRHDLGCLDYEAIDDTTARFRCADPALEFRAEERVQAQFLMHVVTTSFSCRISDEDGGPAARIRIRHRGAWKRTGIECEITHGAEDGTVQNAAQRLAADPALAAAMLPLDFTDFALERHADGWAAGLVHYGASEVVYRFPPARQYVRLAPEQSQAILKTFTSLQRLFGTRSRR